MLRDERALRIIIGSSWAPPPIALLNQLAFFADEVLIHPPVQALDSFYLDWQPLRKDDERLCLRARRQAVQSLRYLDALRPFVASGFVRFVMPFAHHPNPAERGGRSAIHTSAIRWENSDEDDEASSVLAQLESPRPYRTLRHRDPYPSARISRTLPIRLFVGIADPETEDLPHSRRLVYVYTRALDEPGQPSIVSTSIVVTRARARQISRSSGRWILREYGSLEPEIRKCVRINALIREQSVLHHVHKASYFGAQVVLRTRAFDGLVRANDPEYHSCQGLIRMSLPVLQRADSQRVMDARVSAPQAFTEFRALLADTIDSLQHERDATALQERAVLASQRLARDAQRAGRALQALRQKLGADAVLAAGGLLSAHITGGASLLATGLAAISGFKSWQDYRLEVGRNPAAFLWLTSRT